MSLPFVRIDHREAVETKKDILSSEISILGLVKKLNNWKRLRKSEISKKLILKKSIKHSLAEINSLLREMPEIHGFGIKHPEKETEEDSFSMEKPDKKNKKDIERELEKIRDKLAKLNS